MTRNTRTWIFLAAMAATALPAMAAEAKPTSDPMSYLDNGQICLGVDLSIGGAVTYLADSRKKVNLINSWDWGRQVQMSFYSGPIPFVPPGAKVEQQWKTLGWNPIQSGDFFGHRSKVLEHRNDGKVLYVKCIPMHWPLDNVPGECTFECWFRLEGRAVRVTSKLVNARPDKTQYPARDQELPAVYTNGPWYKLVTYIGDKPFTGAATTTVVDLSDGKGWPWRRFLSTECWAALLDKDDTGLGVYLPGALAFQGGFSGKKGAGGPKDGPTGYMTPTHREILDHNISYSYDYALIVGSRKEIRDYVYAHAEKPTPPSWTFKVDRRHWTCAHTTDEGWPIRDELRVRLGAGNAALVSPPTIWQAEKAPKLYVQAAFEMAAPAEKAAGKDAPAAPTEPAAAVMFEPFRPHNAQDWPAWGDGPKPPARPAATPVTFAVTPDGKMRLYEIDMTAAKDYRGTMVQLRLRLPAGKGLARVRYIGFARPE